MRNGYLVMKRRLALPMMALLALVSTPAQAASSGAAISV
jgi:hypothetical protein